MKQSLNNLKIYKSSAGSGKTFTLSRSYLEIALSAPFSPSRYKEILAITFTNKAASEMKSRVIEYLKEISASKNKKSSTLILQEQLLKYLEISEDELKSRASMTLENILHNYSDFNITTIDKFIVRIVRAFNVEMRLSFNFEILLKDEELLSEAFDRLTTEIGVEKGLTSYFLNYQKNQINEDQKWNIKEDLLKTFKAAKNGKGEAHLNELEQYSFDDFQNIQNTINNKIKKHESTLESLAQKVDQHKELLLNVPSAEIRDGKTFISQVNKIADFTIKIDEPLKKTIKKHAFEYDCSLKEKSVSSAAEIAAFTDAFRAFATFFDENFAYYILLKAIQKNFFPYTLIHYLYQKLQEVKKDNNVVLLSEFNEKINDIVLQEPVPFIYERIGERYKNYLIDEFQDTSTDQWQNLLPLLENALSYGETSLIVGDAKQAIYRFRGGEVEQFAKLPAPAEGIQNPIVLERYLALQRHYDDTTTPLTTNYRSKPEVIKFNNTFFEYYLEQKNLQTKFEKYYDTLKQNIGTKKEGGLVQIKTLENDNYLDDFVEEFRTIVEKSDKLEHKRSSICVICRSNKEIEEITEQLYADPNNEIVISSREGLFLGNHEPTKFLFSAFQYLFGIQEKSARLTCINYALKSGNKALSSEEQSEALDNIVNFESFLSFFFDSDIKASFLKSLSHFEIFEELISVLRLNKNSPYLQSLLENILFQSQNSASTLSEWWEENKSKISVSAPEDENAVQMMTLHQSKGLEFGTVVVPKLEKIAEIKANKSTVWINGKGIDLDYEHLLINLKKDIIEGDFGKHEIPEISNEVDALELDTINNLYVTFTRAENHLFIFDQPNKLGADFISKNSKEEIFSVGNWVPPETENKESEWAVFENSLEQPDNWRSKIKVSYAAPNIWNVPENSEETIDANDPRKFGNLIHLIFSEINQDFDYHEAIERIKTKGLIESSIENEIESIFNIASKNIELNNIWKSGKHLKEREIIDEKGNILRPDLIIENDSENIILDFKTGEPLGKDQRQIRYYGQQIENIFGKPSKCILYYTGNDNLQYV